MVVEKLTTNLHRMEVSPVVLVEIFPAEDSVAVEVSVEAEALSAVAVQQEVFSL